MQAALVPAVQRAADARTDAVTAFMVISEAPVSMREASIGQSVRETSAG